MAIKQNILKAWVTTIIGIVTMCITLFLVWNGTFDFVWEGIGGLVMGTILLLVPKSIEKIILEGIRAWGKRGSSYDNYIPEDKDSKGGDI